MLLRARDALPVVTAMLQPADFLLDHHRTIYQAMLALAATGDDVDLISVSNHLRRDDQLDEVGGPALLSDLECEGSIRAHLDTYLRIVHEFAAKRGVIQQAMALVRQAHNGTDLDELATQAEALRQDLASRLGAVSPLAPTLHAVLADTLADLRAPAATLVPLPWPGLTAQTAGGLRLSEYVLLGGRPGNAKTVAGLHVAVYAARHDVPTLVISREMAPLALGRRIYAQQGHVSATTLRRGDLVDEEWTTLERVRAVLADAPLWIDARPRTVRQVVTCVRRHVERCRVRLVILDYLQLFRVPGVHDARARVEEVSAALKGLTQDSGVVIVAISSLSRLQRDGRGRELPPTLSDLRESGQLEHDADWVWLLHHPDPADRTRLNLTIAKGRDGATGMVPLMFQSSILWLDELSTREPGDEAPW